VKYGDYLFGVALGGAAIVVAIMLLARCSQPSDAQEAPTVTPTVYADGSKADLNGSGAVDVIDLYWVAQRAGWTGPQAGCADFQVPVATATPAGPRFVLSMTTDEVDKLVSGEIRVIRACP